MSAERPMSPILRRTAAFRRRFMMDRAAGLIWFTFAWEAPGLSIGMHQLGRSLFFLDQRTTQNGIRCIEFIIRQGKFQKLLNLPCRSAIPWQSHRSPDQMIVS